MATNDTQKWQRTADGRSFVATKGIRRLSPQTPCTIFTVQMTEILVEVVEKCMRFAPILVYISSHGINEMATIVLTNPEKLIR